MSARACAYCGLTGLPLTLEEVFPKFMARQYPSYTKHLSRAFPNVVLPKSRAVKDVCGSCNNEHLSRLDHFASRFCRQLGLVLPGQLRRLQYDHHLLARWIWKVCYNSARANREPLEQLQPLIQYVLGQTTQPPAPQSLIAGIIRTDCCTDEERHVLRSDYLYPKGIRIGRFDTRHIPLATFAALLSVNSYLFAAIVWAPRVTRSQRRDWNRKIVLRNGGTVLPEGSRRLLISESTMTSREFLSLNSWSPDP